MNTRIQHSRFHFDSTLNHSAKRQRGSVTLIIAFMLIMIVGFAGLAIDTGRHYGIKAKLSAASDAAAIAGARGLSNGTSQAERIANAEAEAQRFFDLNYPNGYKRSTVGAPVANIASVGNGRWTVTVNAQATNPNFFMGILGHEDTGISTMSQAIRVSPDIMMVLDSSGSIGTDMPTLKSSAKTGFVNKFIPDRDGDRLGVVSYSSGVVIAEPINKTNARGFNKRRVDAAIDSMTPSSWTNTSDAMRRGLEELNAVPIGVRSTLRVMLVFSDGAPNVMTKTYNSMTTAISPELAHWEPDELATNASSSGLTRIPTYADGNIPTAGRIAPRGNRINRCNIYRVSRNLTENVAAMARRDGVVIYTVGLGSNLTGVEPPSTCGIQGSNETGESLLRRLANTDIQNPDYVANEPRGLYCHAPTAGELERCFDKIANDILRLTM